MAAIACQAMTIPDPSLQPKLALPNVVIFARWPEPGKAKTRLIPGFGAEGAAAIYTQLLEHTVNQALASGLAVELRVTGAPLEKFADWFGSRLAKGSDLSIHDQGEGDLGAKMARVKAPAILIGSDCPGLDAALLLEAAQALQTHQAVIGPAQDGGYYLLGIARPMPFLFEDMAWSTDQVLPDTLARLEASGIAPVMLATLSDVDEPQDLAHFPQFKP